LREFCHGHTTRRAGWDIGRPAGWAVDAGQATGHLGLDCLRPRLLRYAEASGIADAIMQKHAMRARIMPSGVSMGRLLPLCQGRATFGFLANELHFAAEV
jgi:hypothetical protein